MNRKKRRIKMLRIEKKKKKKKKKREKVVFSRVYNIVYQSNLIVFFFKLLSYRENDFMIQYIQLRKINLHEERRFRANHYYCLFLYRHVHVLFRHGHHGHHVHHENSHSDCYCFGCFESYAWRLNY
jgi:hypothetical protein